METALTNNRLLEKLSEPENQAALEKIIDRLPELAVRFEKLDRLASFAEAAIEDKGNVDKLKTALDHLNLDMDTLSAGMQLVEKLPYFLELANKLELIVNFVEDTIRDEKSMTYLFNQAEGYIEPLANRVKKTRKVMKAAKNEAENNRQQITVFTILKWIKDPQAQKLLSYIQGLLKAMPAEGNGKGD